MVVSNSKQNERTKEKMSNRGKFVAKLFVFGLVVFSLYISFKYAIVSTEYRMYKEMINTCASNNVEQIPQLEPIGKLK